MIPSQLLAIRQTFYTIFINSKIPKISLFINLNLAKFSSWECPTTTPVSWGYKVVVCCCRLLEEYKRKNHHFPQEFDINPRVILVGKKYPCGITLRLDSQEVENSKSRIDAITPSSHVPLLEGG
jgi:hypothetical protein